MIRLLKSLALSCAAIVILFEEWLWAPLQRMMLAFGRLPVLRRLAAFLADLPPFGALLFYLVPAVVLLPFKIAGLWLFGKGHFLTGALVFLGAKLVATALLAWLFALTKPALLQIAWFARAYAWVTQLSAAAHAWVRQQPLYRAARNRLEMMRGWIRKGSAGDQ